MPPLTVKMGGTSVSEHRTSTSAEKRRMPSARPHFHTPNMQDPFENEGSLPAAFFIFFPAPARAWIIPPDLHLIALVSLLF